MNDIRNIVDRYNLRINKYTKKNNNVLLDTDKGKYFIKEKKVDKEDLFNYLNTKKFINYIGPYDYFDKKYEIYKYLDEIKIDNNDKAQDIIYLASILHNKTSFYKRITKDEIKKEYEEFIQRINNLTLYYEKLKSTIEEKTYPSPSEYLLLRNISLIFTSIDSSSFFINKWYEKVKDNYKRRISKIHGNLSLSHIIEEESPYLISWDNSRDSSPVIDFLIFFKNNYLDIDFNNLYDIYNLKYPLLIDEKLLLYAHLLLPEKLDLKASEILNTKEVYKLIEYLKRANELVSKHYSKETN